MAALLSNTYRLAGDALWTFGAKQSALNLWVRAAREIHHRKSTETLAYFERPTNQLKLVEAGQDEASARVNVPVKGIFCKPNASLTKKQTDFLFEGVSIMGNQAHAKKIGSVGCVHPAREDAVDFNPPSTPAVVGQTFTWYRDPPAWRFG